MNICDGDFDIEDATTMAGIVGFAEESIQEENKQPEDLDKEVYAADEDVSDINMRMLKNENPGLFAYVIKTVLAHKRKWAKARRRRELCEKDMEAVQHELEAMDSTESLIEEDDAI